MDEKAFVILRRELPLSLFVVYLAAGLTFGSSIARDSALFTANVDTVLFFSLVYLIAIPASLVINYVSFVDTKMNWRVITLSVFVLSICIMVVLGIYIDDAFTRVASGLTAGFWVAGGIISAQLMHAGHVFVSRIREAVASCIVTISLMFGAITSVPLLLLIFSISGLIFVLLIRCGHRLHRQSGRRTAHFSFTAFIASNYAHVAILVWVLFLTGGPDLIWGFPPDVVGRATIYAYQIIAISYLLIPRFVSDLPPFHSVSSTLLMCIASVSIIFASFHIALGSIVVPVILIATGFVLIIKSNRLPALYT